MTMYVSAISPASATKHEGIARVRWINSSNSTSNVSTKEAAIDWLNKGNKFWVAGEDGPVEVRVVNASPPYLRTVKDNSYTDNLLALPRF